VAPLTQWDKATQTKKQGYMVCDVLLGVNVAAHELQPFINKCTTLRALAKIGRCMQLFVADGFTAEAFALARESGVIPATTTNLFGLEVAKALRELTDVLKDAYVSQDSFEKIAAVFKKLSHIEGAATNLRGTLFEYLVADVVRQSDAHTTIQLNELLKDDVGGQAGVDVLAHHFNQTVALSNARATSPAARCLTDGRDLQRSAFRTRRSPEAIPVARVPQVRILTSGVLSERARRPIEAEAARVRKYSLNRRGRRVGTSCRCKQQHCPQEDLPSTLPGASLERDRAPTEAPRTAPGDSTFL
jgi:hypothetical protein